MKSILIVEDDFSIANLIKTYVELLGYETSIAHDGEIALQMLAEEKYNIVLLDLMLPLVSGENVLRHITMIGTPVIVISAKSSLTERVKVLRAGADDYITKPFEYADLAARIEAVLRRNERKNAKILFQEIEIDEDRHRVTKGGEVVELTPKEYDLLCFLMKNKNKVLPKNTILRMVWSADESGETRTVDVHIQRLRKKLALSQEIKTITKVGYILEDVGGGNDL